ncbi:MAG: helix-turn-helix transcriptional regulator [Candidatus Cloacimonetes bacterium]|jgi:AraC family transcriptional regulator|nr:helix-turn-helix transcriptional regulator [Candidatus Cloacimonadota bacterium]
MSVRLQNGSFFGSAGQPVRLDDMLLAETSYGEGFVVPLHAHAHPFFCLLLEGRMVEHFERRREVLGRGCAFFHPADADHAESFEAGSARLFNIQFGGGWLDRMAGVGVELPVDHLPLAGGLVPWLATRLHEEFRAGGERLVVEGLLLAMIGAVLRKDMTRERHGPPAWLRRAATMLHDQPGADLRLAELAASAGVHPAHFARSFRGAYGCTVGDYQRRLRVEHGARLLEYSALPLSQVALECGFADQSHFTRVFRREKGVTPAVYRRMRRPSG